MNCALVYCSSKDLTSNWKYIIVLFLKDLGPNWKYIILLIFKWFKAQLKVYYFINF